MDEFKFVLRCLVFAALIMFISQYKINDETLEAKAEYAFVESPSSEHLRQAAAGGVKFIRETISDGTQWIKNKMAHNDGGNRHEPSRNQSINE